MPDTLIKELREEITALREQVENLTKERDTLKTVPMKYRRMKFNAELQDEVRQQEQKLAALAEQNEKMREALITISIAWSSNEIYNQHFFNEALSPPDLATPVLNRILAEGMHETLNLYSPDDSAQDWIDKIRACADELEQSNG